MNPSPPHWTRFRTLPYLKRVYWYYPCTIFICLRYIKTQNWGDTKYLLLLPLHTNECIKFSDSLRTHKVYIKQIKKISSLFKNISVSLGWKEYQNKDIVKLFSDEKIKLITMGHRDDNSNFLVIFLKKLVNMNIFHLILFVRLFFIDY